MRPFLPGLCSVKTGTAKARELDWKSLSGDFGRRLPDPSAPGVGFSQRPFSTFEFYERVAAASVRPVPVPWRSRILRPCQAPRNCNPDHICTTARFSYRKPRQGQPQPSLDFQQRARSKHRMPRVKVPTEDNGPFDFLRGQTREDLTIAVDLLFLRRGSVLLPAERRSKRMTRPVLSVRMSAWTCRSSRQGRQTSNISLTSRSP